MNAFGQASAWFSRLSVDHSKHGGRALVAYFGSLIVLIVVIAGAVEALLGSTTTCLGETLQLQLSALDEAPINQFAQRCDLETFRSTLGRDIAVAAVYLLGMGVFVAVWWKESWDTETERRQNIGAAFAAVGVVTFLITALADTITLARIDVTAREYELGTATLISTLSWVRWLLTGVLVVGMVVTVVAWLVRGVAHIFRALFDKSDPESYSPPAVEWKPTDHGNADFGICLSGGGIRSAAFSLGALSALEETPVEDPRPGASAGLLGQADVLASVSGGGYAASAWRIAVGTEAGPNSERALLGDPNECDDVTHSRKRFPLKSDPDRPTSMLFPRLLARRKFLANGRGGLVVTTIWLVLELLWHVGLLLAVVGLVAWPVGRLVDSPIITSPDGTIEYPRLATPGLLVFAVAGLVLVARSFTREGSARTTGNYAVVGLAALGTGLLTLLVALPWLVTVFIPELGLLGSETTPTVFTVLGGGVVATIWRMIQAPLKTYAAYLGGVFLVLGLVLFAGMISFHASTDDELFSGSWRSWLIAVGVYTTILAVGNPDLWSLHPIYCRRLASTFANRFTDDGWTGLLSRRDHVPMSAYEGAPGPKQLICAVAARMDRANTGVPVVSMTFEPDHVTVHPGPGQPSVAIRTAAYEKIFGGRMRSRWLTSVVGLASMSAAAVAPSLGRMSMGSTNALIAALNLRLGVWMPNPMYARGRRASTHVYSMFKEILGQYDLSDPNVYVTDGGHWENLALVELIRRRTRLIISVDASADPPHSFLSLLEAIELALLECNAIITFLPGEVGSMQPAEYPRPLKNWAAADITYSDGTKGRLLYVKAQASQAMPLDVLRYSKEDPSFPNYSTANQFLSEAEFVNLAILGRESIIEALEDKADWLFGPLEQPLDSVEVTSSYQAAAPTMAAEDRPDGDWSDEAMVAEAVFVEFDEAPILVEEIPVAASEEIPVAASEEMVVAVPGTAPEPAAADVAVPVEDVIAASADAPVEEDLVVAVPETAPAQVAAEPAIKIKAPPAGRKAPSFTVSEEMLERTGGPR